MDANSLLPAAAAPPVARQRQSGATAQILLAALLGAFVLFGVGFAQISAAHNAAHDVRHSIGFPCH